MCSSQDAPRHLIPIPPIHRRASLTQIQVASPANISGRSPLRLGRAWPASAFTETLLRENQRAPRRPRPKAHAERGDTRVLRSQLGLCATVDWRGRAGNCEREARAEYVAARVAEHDPPPERAPAEAPARARTLRIALWIRDTCGEVAGLDGARGIGGAGWDAVCADCGLDDAQAGLDAGGREKGGMGFRREVGRTVNNGS